MNTPTLPPTPGQTIGPFFHDALPYPRDSQLVAPGSPGQIRLTGKVVDGAGAPVPDALLELWQLDGDGRVVRQEGSLHRDGWTFTGWGRAATDNLGHYTFTTLTPGPAAPGRPAVFALTVFARGLLNRLITRVYLPEPAAALAADPFLAALAPDERHTLIAQATVSGYRFDVRLQGDGETVFLAYPRHAA